MKSLFVFLMLFTQIAFADVTSQLQALTEAANEQCHLPEKLNPISEKHYRRFLAQVLIPEAKMLNTAFVTGFSSHISRYQPLANCLVVFMAQPNNPDWEKGFSFYQRAKSANAVPEFSFAGFDENENLLLTKTPENGVN